MNSMGKPIHSIGETHYFYWETHEFYGEILTVRCLSTREPASLGERRKAPPPKAKAPPEFRKSATFWALLRGYGDSI